MDILKAFKDIAPYLTEPLVLVGFTLLLVFGAQWALIRSKIIPPVEPWIGGRIVQILLRYGFILALLVILLGFGLQLYKTATPPVDVTAIMEKLEETHRQELEQMDDHYQAEVGDWKNQATAAVQALAKLQGQKDAPPGIDKALAMLADGKTEAAENIFQEIASHKEQDIKEAVVAYLHLGALASIGNTQKALGAYRRATELDSENVTAWNQLGQLLSRTREWDAAKLAFSKVRDIGKATDDRNLLVISYGNIGTVYRTKGNLRKAEAMYHKALAINKDLGRKEHDAGLYGSLGIIYKMRGKPQKAETMYLKALEVSKKLNHKIYMANLYGNLGSLYVADDRLWQAEEMYDKARMLFQELGLEQHLKKTEKLLEDVRAYMDIEVELIETYL